MYLYMFFEWKVVSDFIGKHKCVNSHTRIFSVLSGMLNYFEAMYYLHVIILLYMVIKFDQYKLANVDIHSLL